MRSIQVHTHVLGVFGQHKCTRTCLGFLATVRSTHTLACPCAVASRGEQQHSHIPGRITLSVSFRSLYSPTSHLPSIGLAPPMHGLRSSNVPLGKSPRNLRPCIQLASKRHLTAASVSRIFSIFSYLLFLCEDRAGSFARSRRADTVPSSCCPEARGAEQSAARCPVRLSSLVVHLCRCASRVSQAGAEERGGHRAGLPQRAVEHHASGGGHLLPGAVQRQAAAVHGVQRPRSES